MSLSLGARVRDRRGGPIRRGGLGQRTMERGGRAWVGTSSQDDRRVDGIGVVSRPPGGHDRAARASSAELMGSES